MKTLIKKLVNFAASLPMPIVLLGVCILAYGLLIPWLGFYLDDWYIVLYQKYFGAGDFSLFFAQDRPLFGYVYQVFVPIFRDSKLAWQIFAVFSHALAVIVYWWLLTKLMPTRRKLAAVAALLFAVYPGFQFHWFSVMYSQVFMLYAIYFLSYILMIESLKQRKGKVYFGVGALICTIIGIVPQETFFGLELVRPFIIWLLIFHLEPNKINCLKKVITNWMPYLLAVVGFLVYRLRNASAYSYKVSILDELINNPGGTITRLVSEFFWGATDSIFTTWVNLVELLKRNLLSSVSIFMLVLILIGIGLSWLILSNKSEDEPNNKKNGFILWLSLFATVSAMAPFIAGSFKVTLAFPNNRYLIALAPGASLFLVTLLDSILHTRKQKNITYSVLIGFALGAHLITARSFMLNWKAQQDFFWQLSWRAPGIQPGTTLITEDLPFSDVFSGTSLTAPINLIYALDHNSHDLDYLMLLVSQQESVIPLFKPNIPFNYPFRSFNFVGNTSSILVYEKRSDGCLRVLSSQDTPQEFLYNKRYNFWNLAIPLSNINKIIANPDIPAIPPQRYFGTENRNQWCYYFEKADLARQQKNWEQTIQFYNDAEKAGYGPQIDTEWLPLIDAYINSHNLDQALAVTKQITDHDQTNIAGFCQLWENSKVDESVLPYAEEIQSWLNCRVSDE